MIATRRRNLEQYACRVGGHSVHVGITFDSDERPIRVDIDLHRFGTSFRDSCKLVAELATVSLSCGIPIWQIVDALRGKYETGGPKGKVECEVEAIKYADSVSDLVGQLLEAVGP